MEQSRSLQWGWEQAPMFPLTAERQKHTCEQAWHGDNTQSSHVVWMFHLQTAWEGETERELLPGPVD